MDSNAFKQQVADLKTSVVAAMVAFFSARGQAFDEAAFQEQTFCDLDNLAREAHFFGAGVFPEADVVPLSTAA